MFGVSSGRIGWLIPNAGASRRLISGEAGGTAESGRQPVDAGGIAAERVLIMIVPEYLIGT